MKLRAFAAIAFCASLFATGFGVAQVNQSSQSTPEGFMPYTPTRIEWLTLDMQASMQESDLERLRFQMLFTYDDANTIVICVRYFPDVDREIMNLRMDTARKMIAMKAKAKHWDSWLTVKDDTEMMKLEK